MTEHDADTPDSDDPDLDAPSPGGFSMTTHVMVALLVSVGLSLFFWAVLDTFVLMGFLLWSVVAAAAGALIGGRLVERLWVTVLATAVIRIAIYGLMTSLPG
ncbi:hypothetical protein [Yunchengibacter salinarum]|uniref:hypothetical protein n=1 Tax=Yunchengibacter salinarum TaxID=3133399 RepID=UPI0035B63A17